MQQWSNEETQALVYIRSRLSKELDAHPRYKEVIGDRKLLRFFRGNEGDLEKTCEQILKFLSWRHTAGVNAIRTNIVEIGMCHPTKFPNADKILRLVPSIVINPSLRDRADAPLCVEQYQFDPHSVLMEVSLEEYITFHVYCLEYKSLILEQLSEETEREQLDKRRKARESAAFDATTDQQPYGVILHTCVVRDLSGIGLSHLGREGQEILRAVIGVAINNYPEMMHKCHMINAPWVFNTVWWIIKGWLSPRTTSKVSVMGSCWMDELSTFIDLAQLPASIGGDHPGGIEDLQGSLFTFDIAEGGLLWMPES